MPAKLGLGLLPVADFKMGDIVIRKGYNDGLWIIMSSMFDQRRRMSTFRLQSVDRTPVELRSVRTNDLSQFFININDLSKLEKVLFNIR